MRMRISFKEQLDVLDADCPITIEIRDLFDL
jgi:hypothetical protein